MERLFYDVTQHTVKKKDAKFNLSYVYLMFEKANHFAYSFKINFLSKMCTLYNCSASAYVLCTIENHILSLTVVSLFHSVMGHIVK